MKAVFEGAVFYNEGGTTSSEVTQDNLIFLVRDDVNNHSQQCGKLESLVSIDCQLLELETVYST